VIRRRCTGGPAPSAGPLFISGLALLAAIVSSGAAPRPARAVDWIPPPRVTALLPSATIAPGASRSLTLTIRANEGGVLASWSATSGGAFALGVSPSSGLIAVPAGSIASVDLTVTVPAAATGASSLTIDIVQDPGGGRVAKVGSTILAATGGRPEVLPLPSTWSAPSGTAGSMAFQLRSTVGASETVLLTAGRFNPDANNAGGVFSGGPAPASAFLPGGGVVMVNLPTTIAAGAWAGNAGAAQLSVTSSGGVSNASGFALSSASFPDSLPSALVPRGLTPFTAASAGRDGPASLAARGYWLLPCGAEGIRVIRHSATDSIGMIDANGDGVDDRIVGTIRIPTFAAALSVLPGFVAASGDTLDLGILAAGGGGVMLLDLRVVEDPPFGAWEDFFDQNFDGIDDRILRTIPTTGFATDAAWFRASSGRHVALVADADAGSNPVEAGYDPALVLPGTGTGIIAVDVEAAIDSLGGVPYAAGSLATPGSALDLEVRGGGAAPEVAIADGGGGFALYGLSVAAGAPATVTFVPRGSVALSPAWGTPYARDVAWIPNTGDSAYAAVAAGAGGVQIVRAPRDAGAPSLVLVQQSAGPAIGLAGAWTGTLGVALGSAGVALLSAPSASDLNQIGPAAPPPYTAPVVLSRVQSWGASGGLERALHLSWATSATALRFRDTAGSIPDLMVSDGTRLLVLRPGTAAITGVAVTGSSPPAAPPLRVAPNPSRGGVWLETPRAPLFSAGATPGGPVTVSIIDARGRLVRQLRAPVDGTIVRVLWDGLDHRGRPAASGRYWARITEPHDVRAGAASITLLR